MFTIAIEAQTAEEFLEKINSLYRELNAPDKHATVTSIKKQKKAISELGEGPEELQELSEYGELETIGRAPTMEDANAALQIVNKKFGMDMVKRIIESFGLKKLSHLPKEKIQEFIDVCTETTK